MAPDNYLTKDMFAEKWEKSKEKFYRIAYCYVKNEQDAKEVLSEATYRGYCAMHQLKEVDYFETWMGRILINEAIRFLKRSKKFVEFEEEFYNEAVPDEYSKFEDSLDVYQLLDQVSPELKSLLIFKYFEQMSFKEIGELTNQSENTVKTKIYRILDKLRRENN
ncbi:MAG: sigma-70 family RNA polymerase sigma factor [Lachnospiraceae bacterium]